MLKLNRASQSMTHDLRSRLPGSLIDDLNFIISLNIAFAGFLCSKEFTYSAQEYSDFNEFQNSGFTRLDITFASDYSYAIIRLKRSKIDYNNEGVNIVLFVTYKKTCPVNALKTLFKLNPQPPTSLLLRRQGGAAFTYEWFISTLKSLLANVGNINCSAFSGYSP